MFGYSLLWSYCPALCARFLTFKSLWTNRNETRSLKLMMAFVIGLFLLRSIHKAYGVKDLLTLE